LRHRPFSYIYSQKNVRMEKHSYSEKEKCSYPEKEQYSYPEIEQKVRCLECGDKIIHYRTNKKFCCNKCRDTYFNRKKKQGTRFRRMVDAQLARNYDILSSILRREKTEADIDSLSALGFKVGYATSFIKTRTMTSYACFDISFRVSDKRVFNIRRLSLSLPEIDNQ